MKQNLHKLRLPLPVLRKPALATGRFLTVVAAIVAGVGLSSCTEIDPSFKAYEAQAATNPSPKAIVGLWQRSVDDKIPLDTIKERESYLFRSDGTTLRKFKAWSDGGYFHEDPVTENRWQYNGHGWWQSGSLKFRLSSGKLLQYFDHKGLKGRYLFDRAD